MRNLYLTFYLVDGNLTMWSEWTECSVSCGEGNTTRTRKCTPAKYNGTDCSNATLVEVKPCNGSHGHCPGGRHVNDFSISSRYLLITMLSL